jgi:hypothetical protein
LETPPAVGRVYDWSDVPEKAWYRSARLIMSEIDRLLSL